MVLLTRGFKQLSIQAILRIEVSVIAIGVGVM
jgi:hypothetical protein